MCAHTGCGGAAWRLASKRRSLLKRAAAGPRGAAPPRCRMSQRRSCTSAAGAGEGGGAGARLRTAGQAAPLHTRHAYRAPPSHAIHPTHPPRAQSPCPQCCTPGRRWRTSPRGCRGTLGGVNGHGWGMGRACGKRQRVLPGFLCALLRGSAGAARALLLRVADSCANGVRELCCCCGGAGRQRTAAASCPAAWCTSRCASAQRRGRKGGRGMCHDSSSRLRV